MMGPFGICMDHETSCTKDVTLSMYTGKLIKAILGDVMGDEKCYFHFFHIHLRNDPCCHHAYITPLVSSCQVLLKCKMEYCSQHVLPFNTIVQALPGSR